jgi:hypothetical protein
LGSHFEPLEAQRRPARSSTVILMSDMDEPPVRDLY